MAHLGEHHELPLADRLNDLIREWLDDATATALAGTGMKTQEEQGARAAIRMMRHLHLADYSYTLTTQILDALQRAGLMAAREVDHG